MNSALKNSSVKNPAVETFDRLQRKTAIPIVLVIAAVVIVVNDASIWLLPVVVAVAAICVFTIVGGTRLIRSVITRVRRSNDWS